MAGKKTVGGGIRTSASACLNSWHQVLWDVNDSFEFIWSINISWPQVGSKLGQIVSWANDRYDTVDEDWKASDIYEATGLWSVWSAMYFCMCFKIYIYIYILYIYIYTLHMCINDVCTVRPCWKKRMVKSQSRRCDSLEPRWTTERFACHVFSQRRDNRNSVFFFQKLSTRQWAHGGSLRRCPLHWRRGRRAWRPKSRMPHYKNFLRKLHEVDEFSGYGSFSESVRHWRALAVSVYRLIWIELSRCWLKFGHTLNLPQFTHDYLSIPLTQDIHKVTHTHNTQDDSVLTFCAAPGGPLGAGPTMDPRRQVAADLAVERAAGEVRAEVAKAKAKAAAQVAQAEIFLEDAFLRRLWTDVEIRKKKIQHIFGMDEKWNQQKIRTTDLAVM